MKRSDGTPVMNRDGSPWVRTEARVLVPGGDGRDYVQTVEVLGDLAGESVEWPGQGQPVALRVSVEFESWTDRKGNERRSRKMKAWARLVEVERAVTVGA